MAAGEKVNPRVGPAGRVRLSNRPAQGATLPSTSVLSLSCFVTPTNCTVSCNFTAFGGGLTNCTVNANRANGVTAFKQSGR